MMPAPTPRLLNSLAPERTLWLARTYAPPEPVLDDDRIWTPQQLDALLREVYAEPVRLPRLRVRDVVVEVLAAVAYVAIAAAVAAGLPFFAGVVRMRGGRS